MAVSKISICNQALARVGETQQITDFAANIVSGMKGAIACDLIFTDTVKEFGRGGDWNGLRSRIAILSDYAIAYAAWLVAHPGDTTGADTAGVTATNLVTGGFGWTRSYILPTTCVRVIQFNGMDCFNDGIEGYFEVQGRAIMSNDETCELRYISVETSWSGGSAAADEAAFYAKFDPLMVDALTVLLASKIAEPMRADSALGQSFRQEFERIIRTQARQTSANERRRQLVPLYQNSQSVRSRLCSTRG